MYARTLKARVYLYFYFINNGIYLRSYIYIRVCERIHTCTSARFSSAENKLDDFVPRASSRLQRHRSASIQHRPFVSTTSRRPIDAVSFIASKIIDIVANAADISRVLLRQRFHANHNSIGYARSVQLQRAFCKLRFLKLHVQPIRATYRRV